MQKIIKKIYLWLHSLFTQKDMQLTNELIKSYKREADRIFNEITTTFLAGSNDFSGEVYNSIPTDEKDLHKFAFAGVPYCINSTLYAISDIMRFDTYKYVEIKPKGEPSYEMIDDLSFTMKIESSNVQIRMKGETSQDISQIGNIYIKAFTSFLSGHRNKMVNGIEI